MWKRMIGFKLTACTEISYVVVMLMGQKDGLLVSRGFVRGSLSLQLCLHENSEEVTIISFWPFLFSDSQSLQYCCFNIFHLLSGHFP